MAAPGYNTGSKTGSIEGFLKAVLAVKFDEVARAKTRIPLPAIRKEAEDMDKSPGFLEALQKSTPKDVGIIAEVKKASPSKGDIRPDLDVHTFAKAYTSGGARAISVLTESIYFKGSLSDLETVCRATPPAGVKKRLHRQ